jgi:hypothetical protein
MSDADFLADMRSRINPSYANTIGTESCERKRALAIIARLQAQRDELLHELQLMCGAYVNLLQAGRDRIVELRGHCDAVDVMERSDIHLRSARAAIESATKDHP